MPDWQCLRDHLTREGKLKKSDLLDLINMFIKVISKEPNIVEVDDPVTVVGDIHGQYYDLLQLFKVGGEPTTTKFLFLGDYVDRGGFSIEVIVLLMAIKVNIILK
jgi:serine/threonine-protein phosphatase 2B catalytic subunit